MLVCGFQQRSQFDLPSRDGVVSVARQLSTILAPTCLPVGYTPKPVPRKADGHDFCLYVPNKAGLGGHPREVGLGEACAWVGCVHQRPRMGVGNAGQSYPCRLRRQWPLFKCRTGCKIWCGRKAEVRCGFSEKAHFFKANLGFAPEVTPIRLDCIPIMRERLPFSNNVPSPREWRRIVSRAFRCIPSSFFCGLGNFWDQVFIVLIDQHLACI